MSAANGKVQRLLGTRTADYRPPVVLMPSWGNSLGWGGFSLWQVDDMLEDDHVSLCLDYRTSPLHQARFKLTCADKMVRSFVVHTLKRYWRKSLSTALTCFPWGWAGSEVIYRWNREQRRLDFDALRHLHALDVRPMTDEGRLVFVKVLPSRGGVGMPLQVDVSGAIAELDSASERTPAKGFWAVHGATFNPFFGRSVLKPSWWWWRAKTVPDGGREVFFKWLYKFCYSGMQIYAPDQTYQDVPGGPEVHARDYARQMAEQLKAGGNVVLDGAMDDRGNRLWKIEQYMAPAGKAEDLIDPLEFCNKGIQRGIGICDEIVSHDGNTGGYSRSQVSVGAFFTACQLDLHYHLEAFDDQVVRPLCRLNHGHAEYSLEAEPLLPPDTEQGGQGAKGPPGGTPQPGQPGAAQPVELSRAGGDEDTVVFCPATGEVVQPAAAWDGRKGPVALSLAGDVARAAGRTDREPTSGQTTAGNYRKGKVRLHGLTVSIENPKGSVRRGVSPDGTPWQKTMRHHYGYVNGHEGRDGDAVDVFVGPDPDAELVFVVDQQDARGRLDEHKVMLGFTTVHAARQGYRAHYPKGWRVGPVTALTIPQFRAWLASGNKRKRVADLSRDVSAEARDRAGKWTSSGRSVEEVGAAARDAYHKLYGPNQPKLKAAARKALEKQYLADVKEMEARKGAAAPASIPAVKPAPAAFASAFHEAFARLDAAGGGNNHVSLVDLRKAVPSTRAEFDAHLHKLHEQGQVTLGTMGQTVGGHRGITPEMRAAALPNPDDGQAPLLFVSRRPHAPEPAPAGPRSKTWTPPTPAPAADVAHARTTLQLLDATHGGYTPLAVLRRELGWHADRTDAALHALRQEGSAGLRLSDRGSSDEDRAAGFTDDGGAHFGHVTWYGGRDLSRWEEGKHPRARDGRFGKAGRAMRRRKEREAAKASRKADPLHQLAALPGHAEHAVVEGVKRNVERLPSPARKLVTAAWDAMTATYSAGNVAVKRVAEATGADPDTATRAALLVGWASAVWAKTPALLNLMGAEIPEELAFVPVPALAYLLLTTAKAPLPVLKEAVKLVGETAAAVGRGVGLSRPPGDIGRGSVFLTEDNLRRLLALLASDRGLALFCAALAHDGSLAETLDLAERAGGTGAVELSVRHAPRGGITVAGRHFAGGRFIPAEYLERDPRAARKLAAIPDAEANRPRFTAGETGAAHFVTFPGHDGPEKHRDHSVHDTEYLSALGDALVDKLAEDAEDWTTGLRELAQEVADGEDTSAESIAEHAAETRKELHAGVDRLRDLLGKAIPHQYGEDADLAEPERLDEVTAEVKAKVGDYLDEAVAAVEQLRDLEEGEETAEAWQAFDSAVGYVLEAAATDSFGLEDAAGEWTGALDDAIEERDQEWQGEANDFVEQLNDTDVYETPDHEDTVSDAVSNNRVLARDGNPYRVWYDADEEQWQFADEEDAGDYPGKEAPSEPERKVDPRNPAQGLLFSRGKGSAYAAFRRELRADLARDVSGEPRDAKGEWTKGGAEDDNTGMKTIGASVKGVLAAVEGWEPFAHYGLRSHHNGEGDAVTAEEGSTLPNSYVWDDDHQTDEELPGTSVIAFDPKDEASITKALAVLKRYPHGSWVVVASDDWRGRGQDRGEVVLRAPTVLATLHGSE